MKVTLPVIMYRISAQTEYKFELKTCDHNRKQNIPLKKTESIFYNLKSTITLLKTKHF